MRRRTVWMSAVISIFPALTAARAQDVDVPGNLTMVDSTATEGNILKGGVPFLHNFGVNNTFVGSNGGNLTMSGGRNTASGSSALSSNSTGHDNTASGIDALYANSAGSGNTATGSLSLNSNTTGSENTASGIDALYVNSTGNGNTATGGAALLQNTTGSYNTGDGSGALENNSTGHYNTAIGTLADVSAGDLTNATAIGYGAIVNDSNKIRLGNSAVTVIEGEVGFTASSDRNKKENFQPVEGEEVLSKIRGLVLTSWNYIGQDAKQFRHYGPMAQDFFAAFGRDLVGTIGTPTTITSTDIDGILMVAAKALEERTVEQKKEIKSLKARLETLERLAGELLHAQCSADAGAAPETRVHLVVPAELQ